MIQLFVNYKFIEINPFGAVGKYIYHFLFVKFLGLKGIPNIL